MSNHEVSLCFEDYQRARTEFVADVENMAKLEENIEMLQEANVMRLLRPLLVDTVPSIQNNAATALGRLASHSDELAAQVVDGDVLPQLVYSLAEQNHHYKKAATFVLRSVRSGGVIVRIVPFRFPDSAAINVHDMWPSGYFLHRTF